MGQKSLHIVYRISEENKQWLLTHLVLYNVKMQEVFFMLKLELYFPVLVIQYQGLKLNDFKFTW